MKYLRSLAELTAVTYGTAFLGLVLANDFDLTDIGALKAAATAALPAALAVVYGALARLKGNYNSALAVDTRTNTRELNR